MAKRIALFFLFAGLVLASAFSQSGSATPRFVDNGNGTITDNLTGLMWQQTPSSDKLSWPDAQLYASNLTLAGYADWRVPYRIELRTIVRDEQSNWASWLNARGFKNIQPGDYWSGSYFFADGYDYGWVVNMLFGGTRSMFQTDPDYVWAVRGEPEP